MSVKSKKRRSGKMMQSDELGYIHESVPVSKERCAFCNTILRAANKTGLCSQCAGRGK
jgi:hypothetical protein